MKRLGQYARRQMNFPPATRPRLLAALLLAAGVTLLGVGLKERLSSASYDALHSLAGEQTAAITDSPVVIAYLDEISFKQKGLDSGSRWPRNFHAELLQQLQADGARAVVFDMLFDTPGEVLSADVAFSQALKANGRCILAGSLNNDNSHALSADQNWTRSTQLVLPEKSFAEAAAGWGVDSLRIDDDYVVRRHLPALSGGQIGSLSLATARWLGATNRISAGELWVRYYGPALTIPHVSYSEALETGAVPPPFFQRQSRLHRGAAHGRLYGCSARRIP